MGWGGGLDISVEAVQSRLVNRESSGSLARPAGLWRA